MKTPSDKPLKHWLSTLIAQPAEPVAAYVRSYSVMRALEPRLMLDAAIGVIAAETADAASGDASGTLDTTSADNHNAPDDILDMFKDYTVPHTGQEPSYSPDNTYIFVDRNIEGFDQLLADLSGKGQIVILESDKNGLEQIATALDGKTGVDSVHIFSHGTEQTLTLGSLVLSKDTIGQNSAVLQQIGTSLDGQADILLYGCNFGQQSELITDIATLTGADIAASYDYTGAEALHGNWDLEVTTGTIDAASFSSQNYHYVLSDVQITDLSSSITYGENTVNSAPQLIDSDITMSGGTGDFGGFTLTVDTDGGTADQLGIRHTGTGAGQIGVSGSNVTYGGTIIGTFAGGTNGADLVVTLNSSSSSAATEALIEHLTYANNSNAPTADRDITISLDKAAPPLPPNPGFLINTTTTSLQESSSVTALAGGGFVVTWDGEGTGDTDGIFGQLYDTTGAKIGAEFLINTTTASSHTAPSIAALVDGGFVVTWEGQGTGDTAGVFGQRYNAAGARVGAEFLINTTTTGAQSLSSASGLESGGFVVTWTGQGTGDADGIFGQRYDAAGAKIGTEFRINTTITGVQYAPSVTALGNGGFIVIWQGPDADSDGILGQIYDAAGAKIGSEFLINTTATGRQEYPSVAALDGGGFVVVWDVQDTDDADGIFGQRYDAAGAKIGTEFHINTTTEQYSVLLPSVAALEDGGFVVTWTGPGTFASLGVFSQRYDAAGVKNGSEFLIDNPYTSDQCLSAIAALDGNRFIITWEGIGGDADDDYGIYGCIFDAAQSAIHISNTVTVNVTPETDLTITDLAPTVTFGENTVNGAPQLIDSDITLSTELSDFDDFALTVTTNGGAQDQLGIRNAGTGAGQIGVSGSNVTYGGTIIGTFTGGINGTNLVITLNSNASPAAAEALVENLTYANNSDGPTGARDITISLDKAAVSAPPIGPEFLINTITTGNQINSSIAALEGGGFVITWQGPSTGDSDGGIFGQRYDATGAKVGSEFLINTSTANVQRMPIVAALEGGGFVVTWNGTGPGDADGGIFGQRYDAAGVKSGSEFLINTTTLGSLQISSTIALDGGGFVVTWTGNGTGDTLGIFGQRYDAAGAKVGAEFLINTTTTGTQSNSSVTAFEGGGFIVTWSGPATGDTDGGVFGQRYDAAGTKIGAEFLINTTTTGIQSNSSVTAFEGGGFIVTWSGPGTGDTDGGVFGQRYDAAGTKIGSEFLINTTITGGQSSPSVTAFEDGGFVVTWVGTDASSNGIYGQRYDAAGIKVGTEFLINTITLNSQINPFITALDGSAFIVTWEGNGTSDTAGIFGQIFGPPQAAVHVTNIVAVNVTPEVELTITGLAPTITFGENTVNAAPQLIDSDITLTTTFSDLRNFTLTVTTNGGAADQLGIRNVGTGAGQIGRSGSNITYGGTIIGTFTGGTNGTNLVITLNNNASPAAAEALVENLTYANNSGTPTAARDITISFDKAAIPTPPQGTEFLINTTTTGSQLIPSVTTLDGGGFIVTWYGQGAGDADGIFGQLYNASGTKIGSEFLINTTTTGVQQEPSVAAFDGGGFVVTWGGQGAGDSLGIMGQRYDATGAKVGSEFLINTTTTGNQARPSAINLDGGGFVVTWFGEGTGDTTGIFGQRYNAAGTKIGSEFLINSTLTGNQYSPRVSRLDGGGFIVTWYGPDADGDGIYAQRYDAAGVKVGSEFLINTTTTGTQLRPSIATFGDGGFVITWDGPGTGDTNGIFGQRYDAAGTKIGTEFLINNPAIIGYQRASSVTALVGGGFVVTWQGPGTGDTSDDGIIGQRYNAAGVKIGSEFAINTTIVGNQGIPSVAARDDGGFVVTWYGPGTGDADGIFGQIFGPTIPAVHVTSTATVYVTPQVDLTITGLSPTVTFGENSVNGTPQIIDGDITLSTDLNDFDDFTLTVTTDGGAADQLGIRNVGTGAGQIGVSGSNITYGGTIIGTFVGGANGADLVITLNHDASPAATEALIENLTYANNSDAPTGARDITISLDKIADTFAPQGPEFPVNTTTAGTQANPFITALADGGFLVTWEGQGADDADGIYGQRYDATGTQIGTEFRINSTTVDSQSNSSVAALEDGGFVVTWDSPDANSKGVYGQRYDAAGAKAGSEFLVNTATAGTQQISSVSALAGGGFVVTWSGPDSSLFGSYGQIYDAAGIPVGSEFAINTTTIAQQVYVSGAPFEDGGFVITWQAQSILNAGYDMIMGQRFDASGNRIGSEFLINTTIALTQRDPSVTALDGGGFVVTWTGQPTSDTANIFGQSYDAAGVKVGSEFLINTTTAGDQTAPSVTALDGGGFVVTWQGPDANGNGIYGQWYDASGTAVGSEFLINTTTTGEQTISSVTALAGNRFVVTWQGPDANGNGISSQIFAMPEDVHITNTVTVNVTPEVDLAITDLVPTITFGENTVNATPQLIDSDITLTTDLDDFDDFTITVTTDGGAEDQLGVRNVGTGAGQIGVSGSDITYGGTVIGTFTGGVNGADLIITLNSNASPAATEALIENLTYANTSDAPTAARDITISLDKTAGVIAPQGAEFPVNTTTTGSQADPFITPLADGGFVVTWAGQGTGDTDGIYGQRYDAAGTKIGTEFRINSTTVGSQSNPSVAALEGGGFVVTWDSPDASAMGVYGQRYDAAGTKSGAEFLVNTTITSNQQVSSVSALAGGGFVVTWSGPDSNVYGSYGQIYDASGLPVGSEFAVNTVTTGQQIYVSVASFKDGGFIVTWQGQDANGNGICAQRYDAAGNLIGSEFIINQTTTGPQNLPSVATFADGGFVVTWWGIGTGDSDSGIFGQRFDATGVKVGAEFLINTTTTGAQTASFVTTLDIGGFLVTWEGPDANGNGIYGQRYDATGAKVGSEFLINTTTTGTQTISSVAALEGGKFVVTWQGPDASGNGVFAQILTLPQDVHITQTVTVNVTPEIELSIIGLNPTVTFGENTVNGAPQVIDGDITLSTDLDDFDDFTLTVTTDGGTADQLGIRNVGTGAGQIGVSGSNITYGGTIIGTFTGGTNGADLVITLNSGASPAATESLIENLTYANTSDTPTAARDITISLDKAAASPYTPQGPEFPINTTTSGTQQSASVTSLSDGGFVVTWEGQGTGDTSGIFAQLYDTAGTKIGSEFLINTTTTGNQLNPSVTSLSDGGFVVTWEGYGAGDTGGIFAQRYDAAGVKIGSELLINTTISGSQQSPSVASLSDGGFVITWYGTGTGDSDFGIFGQRYDAAGTKTGSEFIINTTTAGFQYSPSVSSLSDGGFVVTWHGQGTGDTYGVLGQRYDATGTKTGSEFLINSTTSGIQANPSVSSLSGGGFVVTWMGQGTGNANDIIGQIYDATGTKIGSEFLINTTATGDQFYPSVTSLGDGGFVVTWYGQGTGDVYDIIGQRYDAAGVKTGSEFIINTATGSQYTSSVSFLNDGGFVVTWQGQGTGDTAGIFARIYNAPEAGIHATSTVTVNVTPETDLIITDLAPTVTFGENTVNAAPQIIDGDITLSTDLDDFEDFTLTVTTDGGAEDQLGVRNEGTGAGQIGVSGSNITFGGTVIGTFTGGTNGADLVITLNSDASPAATEVLIENLTYANNSDTPMAARDITISLDRVASPALQGAELLINTTTTGGQNNPSVSSLSDGGFVVTWYGQGTGDFLDIMGQRYDDTGAKIGSEFLINTTATGFQFSPSVTSLSDGGFVVTWWGNDAADVLGQIYDADGAKIGSEFIINTITTGTQTEPSVTSLSGGGFVVTWEGPGTGDAHDIMGQRYDAAGAKIGSEFLINTTATGGQQHSSVASLSDGGFVVTWDGQGTGDANDIVGQIYDAAGAKIGSEFLINTITMDYQQYPSVTSLSDGGFVVTWEGQGTGGTADIMGQRFDAAGVKIGSEFIINATTSGNQQYPSVTSLSDGGFVVTWEGEGTDDADGIFGQIYDAAGAKIGVEFFINTTTSGVQSAPSVTSLSDGGFVVTWQGEGPGDADGVFSQIFSAPGASIHLTNIVTVNVTPEVDLTITDLSPTVTFNENTVNDTPQVIDGDITLSTDLDDFGNFILTVTTDGGAEDQLGIRTGSGRIGVSGSNITYEGTVIGTVSGGTNGADLIIILNGNASPAATEALIENLTYANNSDAPTSARDVTISLDRAALPVSVPQGAELPIATADDLGHLTITTLKDGGFVVTWLVYNNGDGTSSFFGQHYDAAGIASGAAFTIATADNLSIIMTVTALDGGGFLITWNAGDSGTDTSSFFGQRYDAAGVATGPEFVIATTDDFQDMTVTTLDDGGFLITWSAYDADSNTSSLSGQRYDAAGTPSGTAFIIVEETANDLTFVTVTSLEDGGFLITGYAHDSGNNIYSLFGRHYDAAGIASGAEFTIATANDPANMNITTLDDGGFVVTWSDRTSDYKTSNLFSRSYDAAGEPTGTKFTITTAMDFDVINNMTVTALDGGGLVVTWQMIDDNYNDGIFGQRYDAAGGAIGTEFTIATADVGINNVYITKLDSGGFIVTWYAEYDDNDIAGLFSQRYDAAGAPVGAESMMASGRDILNVNLTTFDGGDFVITWQEQDADGNDAIIGQRYDAAGDTVGTKFMIAPGGDTYNVDITALADGGFLLTWYAGDIDSNTIGYFGQSFDAAGEKTGTKFSITSVSFADDLSDLSTIVMADGKIFSIWREYDGDIYTRSISGQIFEPGLTPVIHTTNTISVVVIPELDVAITDMAPTVTFGENAVNSAPQLIDSDITLVTDATDFDGFSLIVTTDGGAEDQLGICNVGTGAGQIGVSGSNITYGGTVIGTFTGGANGADLVITLNEDASPAAAEALIENLTYANNSDTPADARDLTVSLEKTVASSTPILQGPDLTIGSGEDLGYTSTTLEDGGFLITWSAYDSDNDGYALFGQRYDATGVADGAVFAITTADEINAVEIATFEDGGFLITWTAYDNDNDISSLSGQRYDAAGIASGAELTFVTANDLGDTAITTLEDGEFLVTWVVYDNNNDSDNIFSQRYDAAGVASGAELTFVTAGDLNEMTVTTFENDGFLITWTAYDNDNNIYNLSGQRYDAAGVARGTEFTIATTDNSDDINLTPLEDGGFIVTWPAYDNSNNTASLFGQRYDAAGVASGTVFTIATADDLYAVNIATFEDGGFLITWTAYENDDNSYNLAGQRYDVAGVAEGPELAIPIGDYADNVIVTSLEDGGFLITWSVHDFINGADILSGQRYDSAGTPDGSAFTIATMHELDEVSIVTLDDSGFLITWTAYDDNNDYTSSGQHYDAAGEKIGTELLFAAAEDWSDAKIVALDDGGFIFISAQYDIDTSLYNLLGQTYSLSQTIGASQTITVNVTPEIDLVITDLSPTVTFGENTVNTTPQVIDGDVTLSTELGDFDDFTLTVTTDGGAEDQLGIRNVGTGAGQIGVSGNNVTYDGTIIGTVSGGVNGADLVITLNDDASPAATEALIENLTYANTSDAPTAARDITISLDKAAGSSPQGTEFSINTTTTGNQSFPSVTSLSDGRFVITWQGQGTGDTNDVMGQLYDTTGAKIGPEFIINTTTTGYKYNPSVTSLSDGGFVVTWYGQGTGDTNGIFGQLYDAAGAKTGSEFIINTTTTGNQSFPSVTSLSDGGFVVTWSGQGTGDANDVMGQLYDAIGAKIGSEFIINTTTMGNQAFPSVTSLSDGGFVVTWEGQGTGDTNGIFGQLYDAAGAKTGTELPINTTITGEQYSPSVTSLNDGGFIVTWYGQGTGDAFDIMGQIYDAAGAKTGSEFIINTTTTDSQSAPSVTSLSDGGFVVTWYGQGTTLDVMGQLYDAAGVKTGSEFPINTTTTGTQYSPSVASLSDGGFVVTWQGQGTGDTNGIFGQVFSAPVAAIHAASTVIVNVTPENDAPTASDTTLTTDEDTDGTVNLLVLAADMDSTLDGSNITIGTATHGTATYDAATGIVTYTPDANYNGSDSFTYTVDDGAGGTITKTISVTVTGDNDVPTASDTTLTTDEDTDGTVNLLALAADTDSTLDGSNITVGAATHGTLNYDSLTGIVTYTPDADYNGADSFTYTVNDGDGGTVTKTVSVTVTAINDAPTASDTALTTNEDTDGTLNLLALVADIDTALDGNNITISTATHGTAVYEAATGIVTYTPDANYNGSDSFTYTVNDGAGGTVTKTVSVTVTAVNDAPTASDTTLTTAEDTDGTLDLLALAADNDTAIDGSNISIGTATHGTATYDAVTGTVTYTPDADYNGSDSFTYTVDDGAGGTVTKTVSVTVTAVNDTPTASDASLTTNEDTDGTLNLLALAGDVDAALDGDDITIGTAAHGTAVYDGLTGIVTYTPDTDYNGPDSFTYTVDDGAGGTVTKTVSVTVTAINDAPTASGTNLTTNEDTDGTVNLLALAADSDSTLDGSNITVGTATHGTTTYDAATGIVTYTPNADYAGSDSFTYTVDDGDGGTVTKTVSVTVTGINDAPTASDTTLTTNEDTDGTVNLLALAADTDTALDGNNITVGTGTHGTTSYDASTGTVTYTPHADYNGSDSFTYTVNDGAGGTITKTVSVTVTAVNDAPTASNTTLTTAEDTDGTVNLLALAADIDTALDGNNITVGTGTHGTTAYDAVTGIVTYTPNSDYTGPDSFTYTVDDGAGGTVTKTVSVTVAGENDAPTASDTTLTTNEDTDGTLNLLALAADTDTTLDGGNISIGTATHGTAVYDSVTGVVTYTPDADYSGSDSFTYTVNDGVGGTVTKTVSVTVTAVNDAPTASDTTLTTNEDTDGTLNLLALAADIDTALDGGDISIGTATHGTAVYDSVTGVVTYTPDADYSGSDSFTYTVNDGVGGTVTKTVSVTVTAVNDAPTASNANLNTAEDTDGTLNLLALATDIDTALDGNNITVGTGTHGTTVYDAATGIVTYTPNTDYNGSDSFTYTVDDGAGGTVTKTVSVTVTAVNDAPTASNTTLTTNEDTDGTVNLFALATDIDTALDGTNITVGTGTHGTTTYDAATGIVTYTPNADYNGSDSFTYTVNDGAGGTVTKTVSVTVTAANDAPTASNTTLTTNEDTAGTVNLLALAADIDTALDGSNISVGTGTHGTTSYDATTGIVTYTPATDYNGSDSFTYTVNDGVGVTVTKTVSVTVTAVNDAPTASNTTLTTNEDTDGTVNLLALAADIDTTLDGSNISIGAAAHGTAVYDSITGIVTYTPATDYNGSDSFTYTVNDGAGGTVTKTVSVTVTAVNDAPTASDTTLTTNEDTDGTLNLLALTADIDSTLDGSDISIGTAAHGTAVYDAATGVVTYTPDANYNGADSFTYTVNDGAGGTVTKTVSVTVTAVNDAPTASDTTLTADEDTDSTLNLLALTADIDTALDGSNITVGTATHGTISYDSGTGVVTYTPDAGFNGPDSFTYTVNDSTGGIITKTVSVTVANINDIPTASNTTLTTNEDTDGTVNLLALAADTDNTLDGSNISIGTAAHGTAIYDAATGIVTYKPGTNYNGSDSFTYTVNDGAGGTVTKTVSVTVTAVNDAPTASDTALTANENTGGTLNLLSGVSDIDTALDGSHISVGPATHGTAVYDAATGIVTYTPDTGYLGTDSFTYTVDDGAGGIITKTVAVTVTVPVVNDNGIGDGGLNILFEEIRNEYRAPTNINTDNIFTTKTAAGEAYSWKSLAFGPDEQPNNIIWGGIHSNQNIKDIHLAPLRLYTDHSNIVEKDAFRYILEKNRLSHKEQQGLDHKAPNRQPLPVSRDAALIGDLPLLNNDPFLDFDFSLPDTGPMTDTHGHTMLELFSGLKNQIAAEYKKQTHSDFSDLLDE